MSVKFDPNQWNEVKPNVSHPIPEGRLWLRLSQAAPVYIEVGGVETLVGIDTEVDVTLSEAGTFKVDGKARAFLFSPFRRTFEPQGEVFTNADRMPMESGTMAEVTKGLRMFRLMEREMRQRMQQERAELDAEREELRQARKPSKPAKEAEQVPPATPEAQTEEDQE